MAAAVCDYIVICEPVYSATNPCMVRNGRTAYKVIAYNIMTFSMHREYQRKKITYRVSCRVISTLFRLSKIELQVDYRLKE